MLHGLLIHKNRSIPTPNPPKKCWGPPFPLHYDWKKGVFSKVVLGFQTSDNTSDGLGEIFEGDSADTRADKFPLVLMGG